MNEVQPLTLYELNNHVRMALSSALPDECWVQAELSDVRVNSAGHCYVEFVQKDARTNALLAKARGTVWGNVFRLLRPYFERETGQSFSAGIKVLVQVRVEFHELYGYSLTVTDIDPSYTVGDMVRRRREILRQLEEEGVLTLNKELPLTILPQRIAVISSPTAAGYGDFCNQLSSNPYGLQFYPQLFPAIMQGDRVESSILEALDQIHATISNWDVVVIIRGGGSVSDLSGFDTYLLAAACAQFPVARHYGYRSRARRYGAGYGGPHPCEDSYGSCRVPDNPCTRDRLTVGGHCRLCAYSHRRHSGQATA